MRKLLAIFFTLIASPALAQFPGSSQGSNTGLWNDQSATWATSTSDDNLVSHASRFNHLFVGEMSKQNASFSSSPKSWFDSLSGMTNVMVGAQIAITSTIGTSGLNSAARSSDERAALGTASGGSAGAYLFGVNDDTTGSPIALGSNSVGIHQAGSGVTLGSQQDINSIVASACVPTADSPLCSGATTIGQLITSGAFSGLATQDVSSAMQFGLGYSGGPKFLTGLIIDTGAIRAAQGPSILGSNSTVAIGLPQTNYIVWYGTGNSAAAAVWAGGSGSLNLFTSNQLVINGTQGANCGPSSPTSSFTVTRGIVTTC